MPSVLRNEKIASCDLENGMDVYLNGERLGYTLGECQLQGNATYVDLFQGQPSKLVGSRLAKLEGMATIPCLELTPENHALASGIGALVTTNSTIPGESGSEYATLMGVETFWLPGDDVASIVVKSADDVTTYVADTDYEVVTDTDTGSTGIKRKTGGAITTGTTVHVTYTFTLVISQPYLFFGAAKAPITMPNLVFAKYNPGASDKPWHIVQVWQIESKSNYALTWNQDSQSWMTLNLEFGILSDEDNTAAHHDKCPMWMETWAESFDIQNLPPVPTNYTSIM